MRDLPECGICNPPNDYACWLCQQESEDEDDGQYDTV